MWVQTPLVSPLRLQEEEKFALQQKAKLEEEKNKIKNDESIIADERKKMLEKIEEKEKEMKKVERLIDIYRWYV